MKRPKTAAVLLVSFYCIPFAFLGVYGDAVWGTVLLYGAAIAGFAVLCLSAWKTGLLPLALLGSAASFISSCAAAELSGLGPMGDYFKPFTAHSLIAAISVVSIVAHLIAAWFFARKSGRPKDPPRFL